MPPDAVCDRCRQPATRSLGSEYLCHHCADRILDPIRAAVHTRAGIHGWGIPQHPHDDGHRHHLQCHRCNATWIGYPHDPCWWCQQHLQQLQQHQADLVLQPPDIDPDDSRYLPAMTAWAERLAHHVDTGIITDPQARHAWNKATRDRPAA